MCIKQYPGHICGHCYIPELIKDARVSTPIESHSIGSKPQAQAQAWGLQHPRVLKSPLSCPKFLNRQQSLLLGFPPYFGTGHLTLQSSSLYERQEPTYHCIVGRSFDSFVTNETKHFIYFYLGHCAILLFKTLLRLCHPHSIHPVAHNPVFRFCNMSCIPKQLDSSNELYTGEGDRSHTGFSPFMTSGIYLWCRSRSSIRSGSPQHHVLFLRA